MCVSVLLTLVWHIAIALLTVYSYYAPMPVCQYGSVMLATHVCRYETQEQVNK
jgi:hypothetical protein